uniref:mRNA 5'-phosphatase n=1 Tax=viral metagenome TaxID=1070528 RepID=A0A6C0BNL7_9ZZZZ
MSSQLDQFLEDTILEVSRDRRGLEVEAKVIQEITNRDGNRRYASSVRPNKFEVLRRYYDRSIGVATPVRTVDEISGKFRRTTDLTTNEQYFMRKERGETYYDTDYMFSITRSRENAIRSLPPSFNPTLIREKTRYSYVHSGYRVDLTSVRTVNDRGTFDTYEAEIELTDLSLISQLPNFARGLIQIMNETQELYTEDERVQVTEQWNSLLSENGTRDSSKLINSPLVQSRLLRRNDFDRGGLVDGPIQYALCQKVDGLRKCLMIADSGVWLLYPPYNYNLISRSIPQDLRGSIYDGELVPEDRRTTAAPITRHLYVPFDCICLNGDVNVQSDSLYGRLENVRDMSRFFQDDLMTVHVKSYFTIDTPNKFFDSFTALRSQQQARDGSQEQLPYQTDGMMLTPINYRYNTGPYKRRLQDRSLVTDPEVLKVKDSSDLTVDFGYEEGKLYLNSRDPVTVDEQLKRLGVTSNIEDPDDILASLTGYTVVEFEYNLQSQAWRPRLIRYDKPYPNSLDIGLDVVAAIANPITYNDLDGTGFFFLRLHHNKVKRDLFTKALNDISTEQKILLDIGSGRGGDIRKWRGFTDVIAVEPEHTLDLIERLQSIRPPNMRVRVIQANGQDTQVISDRMKYVGRADVVAMMLSLTFFWESPQLLDELVRTIVDNLQPNGQIILFFMNGDKLLEFMNPSVGGTSRDIITLGPATISLDQDRSVHININETIVQDQKEWLVHIDDLFRRLREHGFDVDSEGLQDVSSDAFMSSDEALFNSLFSFVRLKGSRPEVDPDIALNDPNTVYFFSDTTESLKQNERRKPQRRTVTSLKRIQLLPTELVYSPSVPFTMPNLTYYPEISYKVYDRLIPDQNITAPIITPELEDVTYPDDYTRDIGQTGYVQIYSIDSGMLHSLVKAWSTNYNRMNESERVQYINQLKQALAQQLGEINPNDPSRLNFDSYDFSSLNLPQPTPGNEYADILAAQQALLEDRTNEVFLPYIANILLPNIQVFEITPSDGLSLIDQFNSNIPGKTVALVRQSDRYSTLGLRRSSGIQTVFTHPIQM